MSKVGENPIVIPAAVTVTIEGDLVKVKGQEGEYKVTLPRNLSIKQDKDKLILSRKSDYKMLMSLHGLYRSLIANGVAGVQKPWEKKLEIVGTGFNAKLQGEDLFIKVGYSHPVIFKKIPGVKYAVVGNNKIVVSGVDKQFVGQVAYQIKKIKKPDAYKGKGIRFEGERLRIKPGKKVKTAAAA